MFFRVPVAKWPWKIVINSEIFSSLCVCVCVWGGGGGGAYTILSEGNEKCPDLKQSEEKRHPIRDIMTVCLKLHTNWGGGGGGGVITGKSGHSFRGKTIDLKIWTERNKEKAGKVWGIEKEIKRVCVCV